MPYALLTPSGHIKLTAHKPSPEMVISDGERLVLYRPPAVDEDLFVAVPVEPVDPQALEVSFETRQRPVEIAWANVRRKRDALLAKSDWTQVPDNPMAAQQKQQWQSYRQALRDVTAQASPHNIIWPIAPV